MNLVYSYCCIFLYYYIFSCCCLLLLFVVVVNLSSFVKLNFCADDLIIARSLKNNMCSCTPNLIAAELLLSFALKIMLRSNLLNRIISNNNRFKCLNPYHRTNVTWNQLDILHAGLGPAEPNASF